MKKLLLIGSSLVALTILALGGSVPDSQNTAAVVDAIPKAESKVVHKATDQTQTQDPDEVSAQTETLLVNGGTGTLAANSVVIPSDVVDLTNTPSKSVARSTAAALSTKVAQVGNLSAGRAKFSPNEPTPIQSYGPNGTHWPNKYPTPFMYDSTVANIVYVEPNWDALKAAIESVTVEQQNAGTLILIKSGTTGNPVVMEGFGNGSGSKAVFENIGWELRDAERNPNGARINRITVAPSNGYGTLKWDNGVRMVKVKGIAFAGIIAEQGMKTHGCTQSAFAWMWIQDSQSGFYGTSGQTTYGVEIVEYVVPKHKAQSDDTLNIYSGGGNVRDFEMTGTYLAPRFYEVPYSGAKPHTDTFQAENTGSGDIDGILVKDTSIFSSNNSSIQTGKTKGIRLEHSLIVSGKPSLVRHPHVSGGATEATTNAFNGSGGNFESRDSIIIGGMGLNSSTMPQPWLYVDENTRTSQEYTSALNVPINGTWTVDTSLANWGKTELDRETPLPTEASMLEMWDEDTTPRTESPVFSPSEDTHIAPFSVSITSATPGASIYYTTNGTEPSATSTRYVGPFTVSTTTTVKAVAIASSLANSHVQSKTYTMVLPAAPTITTHPANQTAVVGGTATFTVAATANPAISGYQWKKNGSNIAGATSASYTTPVLSSTDSGAVYTVSVSNSYGTVTSNPATLTVSEFVPVTSSGSFKNVAFGSQSGTLVARFKITPNASSMNAVTGLSGSPASSYGGISAIVRMNNGIFDAYNGSAYDYDGTAISFVAGQTYQIEMALNTTTGKYSVKVDGTTIATDYSFRTAAASLSNLSYQASTGTHTISDFTIAPSAGEDNSAPVVNAGADRTITLPANSVSLDATVTDDGRPTTTLINTWIKQSGPGTVSFANASSVDTTATFSAAGTYVLRLTSNDGDLSSYDEVTVTVNSQSGTNNAPVVSAGADLAITLPTASVSLDATVTDDGLPAGSAVSQTWTKVSGTGTVSFANASSVDTTATFSAAGTYVLRLTATDGSLTSSDDVAVIVNASGGTGSVTVSGELKKWHKVTLSMEGPMVSETTSSATVNGVAIGNPFRDLRADVTFTHSSGKTYKVPAYFAADGNAAETGADAGNVWRAHFAPDMTGVWSYAVSFRTGADISISTAAGTSAGYFDGATGSFSVGATDKTGRDLRSKGRLIYDGEHYLKFAETGERFIKAGVDSPESFLAYNDFDNTTKVGSGNIKSYSAHAGDFAAGDPSWDGGRGTEIIGAVNYLASEGLNSFSFLTLNVGGDDGNIYPYISKNDEERFDTSKLDQWGVVFDHATKKGMYLHFKMLEVENDDALTDDQFKLYSRELIARYGHNLALNWNLGEENGRTDTVIKNWAQYIDETDPYHHNLVIHLSNSNNRYGLMGSASKLTGFSLQSTDSADFSRTFTETKNYVDRSAAAGKKWVVGFDETGEAPTGVMPDSTSSTNQTNQANARKHGLWGAIMAGGAGIEWYFGYNYPNSDLTLEDFRSRNNFFDYSRYAVSFLENNSLPVAGMTNQNSLISGNGSTGNKVLAKTNEAYLVQLINGGSATLNLSGATGTFNVTWLNPRTGVTTAGTNVAGGSSVSLVAADSNDWIVLVKKGAGSVTNAAPVANAGADQAVARSAGATLAGSATDDGLPAGSSISYSWTKVSGAGTVSFANASSANTTATFSAAGTYVLQLAATDGALTGNDTVQVVVTDAPVTSAFNSAGGVLVMETENTASSLGNSTDFWNVLTPGESRYVAGATGDAHLEYRSDVGLDDTPGETALEYVFKINQGGYYQLHIRSHKNLEDINRPDLNNDAFIKVEGLNGSTYGAGPNAGNTHLADAPLSMLQSYNKIAGGSASTWAWADQLDAGGDSNKRWPVYNFQTGGTYKLTMSGRSRGYAPDRFVFRKIDEIPMPLAKNYGIPESSKVDGGINPNIAPMTYGSTQVRTVEVLNVRPGAGLSSGLVGKAPFGSTGTLMGGPTVTDNITWWQVDFAATTTDGWVGGDNLEVIPGTGTGTNVAPVVSAGSDVSIQIPVTSATLTGTATDSDGTIASRQWTKVSGGAATLSGETTNTLSLSGLAVGTYTFRFTATDNDGTSSSDDVTVTVSDVVIPTGPVVYVRDGATGNGSSWSSALDDLPSSLVRGTTYYVADGSYGGKTVTTAKSGNSMITIKKAVAGDHGDNDGWQSSYGDGQAVFTGRLFFQSTGYFTIDGNPTATSKFDSKGIVIRPNTRDEALRTDNANDMTFKNLEIDGNFDDTFTCDVVQIVGDDVGTGADANYKSYNITFRQNYIHNGGDDGFLFYDTRDIIFEDNVVGHLEGWSDEIVRTPSACGNGHSDGLEIKSTKRMLINRNYIHTVANTSGFLPNNWISLSEVDTYMTNNIIHVPDASVATHFNNMDGARVYHNTFLQAKYGGILMDSLNGDSTQDVSDFKMRNNIISSWGITDQFGSSGRDTGIDTDYNLIIGPEILQYPTYVANTNDIDLGWEANKEFPVSLFAGSDLNTLYVPGQFHPNKIPDEASFAPAATNPGINKGITGLPSTVTVAGQAVDISKDYFGNSRTGAPDMGAIEFVGTPVAHKTVAVTVFGAGDVTANGISCGDDCYGTYSTGDSVTLTATPRADATFTSWKGACTGTSTTCTVTVNDFKNVIATFLGGVDPDAWQIGDRVEANKTVKVRSGAGTGFSTVMSDRPAGTQGTVTGGPAAGSGITWYKIKYDGQTVEGWTGADGLNRISSGGNTGDTEKPSVPAGLSATGVSTNSATLSWSASTDNVGVAGYEIKQSGVVVGTTNAATLTFNVTGLAMGTSYSFTVRAFDAAGNKSNDSAAVSVTTTNIPDIDAPSVPTGLAKTGATNTTISLLWSASIDNVGVTSYEIFRNGTSIATVSSTSFTDSGLTKDTTYSYAVKAKDAAGNTSGASAALSVTTTNTTSNVPVRIPSFGPNGSHWPEKIPTPFMYDETVPKKIVVKPTWAAIAAAIKSITDMPDAEENKMVEDGVLILIESGTVENPVIMVGTGNDTDGATLENLGSNTWPKRVTVAPQNGYGTLTWGNDKVDANGKRVYENNRSGVYINNVNGVAFAGLNIEKGIRLKGSNRSALAWVNIIREPDTKTTQFAPVLIYSKAGGVQDIELSEVVVSDSKVQSDDTVGVATSDGGDILKVTIDGSYFAPSFFDPGDCEADCPHTDTLQYRGQNADFDDQYMRDTALFGSNNGTVQFGTMDGLDMEHILVVNGAPSLRRYPHLPGGSTEDTTKAFNGGAADNFRVRNSIIIGALSQDDTSSLWDEVINTTLNKTPGAKNQPSTPGQAWTIDTLLDGWGNTEFDNISPIPTQAYLNQIWAKDATPVTYRTITVTSTGSGTVSGAVSGQRVADGTSITLTATPAAGAAILGWGGACTGTSTTCTVVMTADKSVTVSFSTVSVPQYALSITTNGTGAGTVSGATNGQLFDSGAVVTLTPNPATGSTFSGWSGACTGTALTCTVTMSSAKSVTAMFNTMGTTMYVLSANKSGSGSGTISGSAQNQTYPVGTVVTLTATPATGSSFGGWSGDCAGTGSTCTVTMTSNKSVVATFLTMYPLTINKSGTGTGVVLGGTSGQTYAAGTVLILGATPDATSNFTGWSGSCSGTSSTCTVTMSSAKTVTATFALKPADQVSVPTLSPSSTSSTVPVTVSMSSATAGAEIRYTTNGSTPTSSSTLYSGPITITSTQTVKAIAFKSGMTNSSVASATYTINTGSTGPAYTSSSSFDNVTFQELSGIASRSGKFTATFTVSALSNGTDAVTGFSSGKASSFTAFGPNLRMGGRGFIDARNGDAFESDVTTPYVANQEYAVRMDINVTARTYSVWVDGVKIASDYAFRSSQDPIGPLTHFGYRANSGSHRMTGVVIGPDQATDVTAPTVPAGLSASNVTANSANLSWTASSDAVGVTGYEILRNGTVVSTSNSTSYSATGLTTGTTYQFAVRAFDAAGNKSAASSVVSVTPTAIVSVTLSSTPDGVWGGKSFTELSGSAARTGSFEVNYTATPSGSAIDAITGLSDGAPTKSSERFIIMAPIVRFNPDGKIDARNGGAYAATNSVSYSANQAYAIKMQVNVATRTYSAWVNGTQIANNYAFRSEQAAVTELTHFGYVAVSGSHKMSNVSIGN